MTCFRRRAVGLLSAAIVGAAVLIAPVLAAPNTVAHLADCPDGSPPNAAGYACVTPNPVGAPSQMEVTRCGGNHYYCFWPYTRPGTP